MEFFGYRNLVAYVKAKEVRLQVYRLLKRFPKEEQFALCNQLRRAAVSITSNIAEGMTRFSTKDKVHFIEIAYGSLMEVMSQLEVAQEENYISIEDILRLGICVNKDYKVDVSSSLSWRLKNDKNISIQS